MANYGVQKSSLQAVLMWYESQDEAKFSIFRGNKENDAYLTDAYTGTDKEQGTIQLQRALQEIETTDFNIYFLKLYPANIKTKKSAPGVTFQLYTPQAQQVSGFYQSSNQNQVLTELLNEVRALREERLNRIEEEEEEEPETENDFLAGIVNNPQMQNFLLGVLSNVFTNNAGNKPVQAMAGIETDESLQTAITTLLNKGVTVADIVKLSQMEQQQINFLLSMLRK